MRHIDPLFRLELCNFYGLNTLLHTRDKKAKRRALALLPLYLLLVAAMAFYAGMLSYGLVLLGAGETVVSYLVALASLIVFFFAVLKAGSVLFSVRGYDMLCALPVRQSRIVLSRFLRMYLEDLLLALTAILPGLIVCGVMMKPGPSFWLWGVIAILTTPLLPLSAATLVGALVAAFSSRMKHKSLAAAVLTLLAVFVILLGTSWLTSAGEELMDPALLLEVSAAITAALGRLYPPALWLGSGEALPGLAAVGLSLAVFGLVVMLASVRFHAICRRLAATSARHDYRLSALKTQGRMKAICIREFRRYFASSVYVTNTIIGPIMGLLLAGGVLFTGSDKMEALLGLPLNVRSLLPFVLAFPFAMMPPTAVSVSMEGKQWWLAKSLPLSTRDILDAKLLMSLLLELPFCLLAQILLCLAFRPGLEELLWLILIPATALLFSCTFALWVNLRLPVLDWENEVRIVKQSAASAIGGLGGILLPLVGLGAACLVPAAYGSILRLAFCGIALALTTLLYTGNLRRGLCHI